MQSPLKHAYTHRDGNAICDIADEVEKLFGFGCCQVHLSIGFTSLYVDSRFPTWERAFEYARELIDAAHVSREEYASTIRK
jgi:hypothetical protein